MVDPYQKILTLFTNTTFAHKVRSYVMLYAIWWYLFNLKNAKNTHEEVLLLAKLQATNGTRSRKASQSLKSTKYMSDLMIKSQM